MRFTVDELGHYAAKTVSAKAYVDAMKYLLEDRD